MKTHQNLIGNVYGRLTVTAEVGKHPRRRDFLWLCRCDCGNDYTVRGGSLKEGKTRSCGCLNDEVRIVTARENGFKNRNRILSNLRGQKFGRLTAWTHTRSGKDRSAWLCKCECGTPVIVLAASLVGGTTLSCGCLNSENKSREATARNTTHGLSHAPEYSNWSSMMARCFNLNDPGYEKYGGAGRTVCEFIRASPLNMVLLMGRKPTPLHSIDRKDNKLGYFCGSCAECVQKNWPMNVRWATQKEQLRNRSNNVLFEIDGVTRCASEWAEKFVLTHCQFSYRYRKHKVVQSG